MWTLYAVIITLHGTVPHKIMELPNMDTCNYYTSSMNSHSNEVQGYSTIYICEKNSSAAIRLKK